jgi:hypothetical protein
VLLHHDDHVDGVKLRLLTTATNGPILLFIPQVICVYEEKWWNDINGQNLLNRPPDLSSNSTSRHLVAKQDELEE